MTVDQVLETDAIQQRRESRRDDEIFLEREIIRQAAKTIHARPDLGGYRGIVPDALRPLLPELFPNFAEEVCQFLPYHGPCEDRSFEHPPARETTDYECRRPVMRGDPRSGLQEEVLRVFSKPWSPESATRPAVAAPVIKWEVALDGPDGQNTAWTEIVPVSDGHTGAANLTQLAEIVGTGRGTGQFTTRFGTYYLMVGPGPFAASAPHPQWHQVNADDAHSGLTYGQGARMRPVRNQAPPARVEFPSAF